MLVACKRLLRRTCSDIWQFSSAPDNRGLFLVVSQVVSRDGEAELDVQDDSREGHDGSDEPDYDGDSDTLGVVEDDGAAVEHAGPWMGTLLLEVGIGERGQGQQCVPIMRFKSRQLTEYQPSPAFSVGISSTIADLSFLACARRASSRESRPGCQPPVVSGSLSDSGSLRMECRSMDAMFFRELLLWTGKI